MSPTIFLDYLGRARGAARVANTFPEPECLGRAVVLTTEAGKCALAVDWPRPYHDQTVRDDLMFALDQLYRAGEAGKADVREKALERAMARLQLAEATTANAVKEAAITVAPSTVDCGGDRRRARGAFPWRV